MPAKGTFRIPASPGEVFDQEAFASTLGQVLPLKVGDRVLFMVRITSATVAAGGGSVEMAYEAVQ